MTGERVFGVGSADLRGLAEDIRCGQRAAVGVASKDGANTVVREVISGVEFIKLDREAAEMVDESGHEVRHDPGEVRHMHLNFGSGAGPFHFRRLRPSRIEFM